MHIHVIFLIYSSVVGNLGCFLMCAIEEDNATMNAGCKYLFEILISTLLDIIAKSETAGSYGILLLVFEETPYCFPWGNMDIPRGHHTKCNKLVTKVLPDSTYRKYLKQLDSQRQRIEQWLSGAEGWKKWETAAQWIYSFCYARWISSKASAVQYITYSYVVLCILRYFKRIVFTLNALIMKQIKEHKGISGGDGRCLVSWLWWWYHGCLCLSKFFKMSTLNMCNLCI